MVVTKQKYKDRKNVNREDDVLNLTPGDKVSLSVGGEVRSVVYAGGDNLNNPPKALCKFIEIPENYNGADVEKFFIWESYLKYLIFPGDSSIVINHLYMRLKVVHNSAAYEEEYPPTKSLVDLVLQN